MMHTRTLICGAVALMLCGCSGSVLDMSPDATTSMGSGVAFDSAGNIDERSAARQLSSAEKSPRTAAAPVSQLAATEAPKTAGAIQLASSGSTDAYRIGQADQLEISVFKVPELAKAVVVADDGRINFPLIGAVSVGGLTAAEVEALLARELGAKYLQDPQVTVVVKEFNSRRFTVEGNVKKPGMFSMREKTSLVQALAMSGGIDEMSDEQATISREKNGKRENLTYDLAQIKSGSVEDPEIRPGDVVSVGKSMTKETLNNIAKIAPIARILVPY